MNASHGGGPSEEPACLGLRAAIEAVRGFRQPLPVEDRDGAASSADQVLGLEPVQRHRRAGPAYTEYLTGTHG